MSVAGAVDAITLARLSLVGFAGLVDPTWKAFPHVVALAKKLEAVERGEIKRLIVTMPPQHGKSQVTSRFFPTWFLGRNPDKRVILASYEASFAEEWGRAARDLMDEWGDPLWFKRVRQDTKAAARWQLEGHVHGGMRTAGVGGPVTGKRADLFVIDDPIKNDEEANSETIRQKIWNWFRSVAYTRLSRNGAIVLVMTRWHEQDLAGMLVENGAEKWDVLRLPAIAEEDDPLGRAEGRPLCPQLHPAAELAVTKTVLGSYRWSALYQLRPTPEGGDLFQKRWFRYYREQKPGIYELEPPRTAAFDGLARFATVDLATSTKETADYTVIMVFGVGPEGHVLVLDVMRERLEGPDIVPALHRSKERWKWSTVWIEKVAFQLSLVQQAIRGMLLEEKDGTVKKLPPLPARELERAKGEDKRARAIAATPDLEAGKVWFPTAATWLVAFETELLAFRGKDLQAHDDQVDTFSDGVIIARSFRGGGGRPFPRKGRGDLPAGNAVHGPS